MNIENYKKLYKGMALIINRIDPCYYNGPAGEYDFQVNGIIKLIENNESINYNRMKILFFGDRKNIVDEEQKNLREIIRRISLLVNGDQRG